MDLTLIMIMNMINIIVISFVSRPLSAEFVEACASYINSPEPLHNLVFLLYRLL